MSVLKHCSKCVHYVFKGKSKMHDLSECAKFDTFASIARFNQCGEKAWFFQPAANKEALQRENAASKMLRRD